MNLMKVNLSAENGFILSISDDAKPFDPTQTVSKGRGIANIKSRSALIEAEVIWVQNKSVGTEFLLYKK